MRHSTSRWTKRCRPTSECSCWARTSPTLAPPARPRAVDEIRPDRVLDTPISEAAIVGAAIGAAIDGLLPVAEIMIMDFIGLAADQLINNAAKLRFMTGGRTAAPITVRTQVYGGLATGATHSQSLEAWFMHVPG
ncbi:transketolase, pyrimidine binding domain protein [Mycobacterium xenopi 3993]|nr:transketolase, pyrimidine binding domain protein [Mycobacterium xenopi 3993]